MRLGACDDNSTSEWKAKVLHNDREKLNLPYPVGVGVQSIVWLDLFLQTYKNNIQVVIKGTYPLIFELGK